MATYCVVETEQMENQLTEIADAIREKTGDTGKIPLEGMAETLKRVPGPIIATASGSLISLTDAADLKLRGLKLLGKTTQDGTPTPEAPVPLVSAGDGGSLGVTVVGKNLLDITAMQKGRVDNGVIGYADGISELATEVNSVSFTTVTAWRGICSAFMMVSPGRKYALKFSHNNSNYCTFTANYYDRDRQYIGSTKIGDTTQRNLTFTVPANASYMVFSILAEFVGNYTLSDVMIELGVQTEYEPYKEPQDVTIQKPTDVPVFLPGIPVTSGGNYTDETGQQWICDEVDFGRGVYVQRVFINVFSDASGWVLSGATSGKKRFGYQALKGSIKGSDTQGSKANLLCSSFPITSAEGTWNAVEGICADISGIVYAYYGENAQTLEAWSNYLSGNPVTVMAALAVPIETTLSAEELAAYAALHTNYPNTTILNDGGAGMEVQYVADTKNYIDNQIAAVAAAIVNA